MKIQTKGIEILSEEAVAHEKIRRGDDGKKYIEMRVAGECTLDGIVYTWDRIIEIRITQKEGE